MGKRAKKKGVGAPVTMVVGSSPSPLSSPSSSISVPSDSGHDAAINSGCWHVPNLGKLHAQLTKSSVVHCLECAKLKSGHFAVKERKADVKELRKKLHLGRLSEMNRVEKLWICLSCGLVGCGGLNSSSFVSNGGSEIKKEESRRGIVGRGHAWQHWLQLKHPLVMMCGDEFVCWCFFCEAAHWHSLGTESEDLLVVESEPEVSILHSRSMLLQASAKLIQEKVTDQFPEVKEEIQESGSSEDAVKPHPPLRLENGVTEAPETNEKKRVMKGLVNLGNTCFLNSVLQNLLGLGSLRNHYGSESSVQEGALTSSLRKFFQEASARAQTETNGSYEARKCGKARGDWGSIDRPYNPKGLFSAICSKAPRFKGFQQHDSHELLRCLLDCLHTEEMSLLRVLSKSAEGEVALRALSTSGGFQNFAVAEFDDLQRFDGLCPSQEGTTVEANAAQKSCLQAETFVERVFGGQLSSTVSCCECGHSSVVYESFLDLSLPIPCKKLPKNVAGLRNGTKDGGYPESSNNQIVPLVKPSKESCESPLDMFLSTPAGLGAPLLPFPPAPLESQDGDCSSTVLNSSWSEGIDLGTMSDDTGWLYFVEDSRTPEAGASLNRSPSPSDVLGCAPRLELDIVHGCAPNLVLVNQSSKISLPSERSRIWQTRLSPPADGDQISAKFWQNSNGGCPNTVHAENEIDFDQFHSIALSDKLLHREVAVEEIVVAENCSRFCEVEKSISHPIDIPMQMRGGSANQSLGWTPDAGGKYCPLTEQVNDTWETVGQPDDCSDKAVLLSDIANGPSGTIILLGPPIESGPAMICPSLKLEDEYEGVGSLFEEVEIDGEREYGPFPVSHDEAGGITTFDEIVFDDSLDLGKVSSAGLCDWLVSNEEKECEDIEVASMSLERCLQAFTGSELLSGDNAWACEICTRKYHEGKVGTVSDTSTIGKPPVIKHLGKDRIEWHDLSSKKLAQTARKSQINVLNEGATAAEHISNIYRRDVTTGELASEDSDINRNDASSWVASESANFKMADEHTPFVAADTRPSAFCVNESQGHTVFSLNRGNHVAHDSMGDDEACQENQGVDGELIDLSSIQKSLNPVDWLDIVVSRQLDERKSQENEIVSPETLVEKFYTAVDSSGIGTSIQEAEMIASELESEVSASEVSALRLAKTSRLENLQSSKVPGELKEVIKQTARKRLLISRAPAVLTIQLKRFTQDMRGRLSKLSGHVAFQESLDLNQFLDHRHVNLDCKYHLIGTVEHAGTLRSGHYVASVKGPPSLSTTGINKGALDPSSAASSWYFISDAHVYETNLEAVLQSEAYLLFYERADIVGSFA